MKKNLLAILIILATLINMGAGVANMGYGCEINQGLLMCGSKIKRLEGCYSEVK